MSFFTFVFYTVLASLVFVYLIRRQDLKKHRISNYHGGDRIEEIEKKLEQIDRRLQSLETIVLERERHNEFDNALNG